MPLELEVDGGAAPLSLRSFRDRIEEVDLSFDCEASLHAAAVLLHRLSRNRALLTEALQAELAQDGGLQASNFYGPNVILLHRDRDYFLRANIWRPISALQEKVAGFAYDICHDHNFPILTVGYSGPGYRCRTYEYDYDACAGIVGEQVDMRWTGIRSLPEGAVMYYRPKQDIHYQLPPDRLSVSLNLIPRTAHIAQPQFQFDEERRCIKRFVQQSSQELLLRYAAVLGPEPAAAAIRAVRDGSAGPHVRALADVCLGEERERGPFAAWLRAAECNAPGSSLASN
jgi:hypothetical protein